ncbi:MAG: lysophospholipid acyltransferase family protein, partial [Candidatus Promineifilaceae bacterium]
MWLRFFVVRFFHWLLWALGGQLQVTGVEKLPAEGAYLLVTNHMSIADSPIMLISLPPEQLTHFWIADKWKTLPVFGYWASQLGGIFIKRDIVDRRAIREAVNLLKSGQVVGLAPEATRSPIGQLIKPRNGAAYLAKQANV